MALQLVVRSIQGRPLDEEFSYHFDQPRILLGRGNGADVRIADLAISESHATLTLSGQGWTLLDQGSTNGTFLNGKRLVVNRGSRVSSGDRIELGRYELELQLGAPGEPTTRERTAEMARRLFREAAGRERLGDARLVLLDGPRVGQSLELERPPLRLVLGRGEHCQLQIDDPDVSREHAELLRDLDGVSIRDLSSKNGIFLGDERIEQRRLHDGDEIRLGSTRLLFEQPADEPIEALTGQRDTLLERQSSAPPAPAAANATDSNEQPAEATASPNPAGRTTAPQRGSSLDADLIIYALSALIIAVSVAGLLFLMSE
ncbi:MAG: FHA domain-containing protein [Myxococcales bacterium]|nr:FHA domain-containing protein [Myxococcales bacterium]